MAAGFSATTRPQFGIPVAEVEGTTYASELNKEYRADIIPFVDGWSRDMYPLSFENGMSAVNDYGDGCRGIASSQVAARNTLKVPVSSARMTIRELVSEPWMRGLQDGAEPTQSQALMCCDGMVVKGLSISVSILGAYNEANFPVNHDPATTPPFNIGVILSGVTTLKTAVESSEELGNTLKIGFPFTSDAGSITIDKPIVRNFSVLKRVDGWATFRLTLEGIAGNTETFEAGETHLLVPKLLLLSAITDQSAYYSLERTIELSRDAPAQMTEAAVIYPDADYPYKPA